MPLSESERDIYWGNIAAGVLPIARNTCRVLLQKRGEEVHDGGTWGLIGGAVGEPGSFLSLQSFNTLPKTKQMKVLKSAVEKEIAEEIGKKVSLSSVKPFYIFRNSTQTFSYYDLFAFVPQEFQLDPSFSSWETQGVRWFSYDELFNFSKSTHEKLHPKLHEALQKIQSDPRSPLKRAITMCKQKK